MLQTNKFDLNTVSGVQDISDVAAEKYSGGVSLTAEEFSALDAEGRAAAREACFQENLRQAQAAFDTAREEFGGVPISGSFSSRNDNGVVTTEFEARPTTPTTPPQRTARFVRISRSSNNT